jgi:hypothetical protein
VELAIPAWAERVSTILDLARRLMLVIAATGTFPQMVQRYLNWSEQAKGGVIHEAIGGTLAPGQRRLSAVHARRLGEEVVLHGLSVDAGQDVT